MTRAEIDELERMAQVTEHTVFAMTTFGPEILPSEHVKTASRFFARQADILRMAVDELRRGAKEEA